MRNFNRIITFFTSLLVTALPMVAFAFSPAQYPLCLSGSKKPMTMLIMGRDHTLFYDAYNDAVDLDPVPDGIIDIGFTPGITYFGYFDSSRCYQYDKTNEYFYSKSKTGGNGVCSGAAWPWSGNFLNYVTMTRIDVLRKVLYGGKRDIDSATETVLIRATIPKESHAWAKQYPTAGIEYEIADYADVIGNPTAGKYHLFASVGDELWIWTNANHEGSAWASQERLNPGVLNPEPTEAAKRLKVRVKVCDDLDDKCQAYTGVNKPEGVLQNSSIDKGMKFGLISGSYDQNLSGGVLRKNVSDFADEIDSDTGQFLKPANGNIVNNIDQFAINSFVDSAYTCGWKVAAPNAVDGMVDGECEDWGNPIGEMLYESMRYFSGASAATPTFITSSERDKKEVHLSTGVTWQDPFYPNGSLDVCLKPFNLVISDLYPTYDGDSVPGNSTNTNFAATGLTAPAPVVSALLQTIGDEDEDHITGGSKQYFYGRKEGAVANSPEDQSKYNPTSKSLSNLEEIRGLAPFNSSEEGSYSSAAMAYWGRINDLRPDGNATNGIEGDQSVQTLVVALTSPLPEFTFTFGSKKVSIIPFGKSPASNEHDIPLESADHLYTHGETTYQPTNAVLDFYVLAQRAGVPTKVSVMFDDVTQGADQDLDVRVDYHFYTSTDNGAHLLTPDPFDAADAVEANALALEANQLRIDTIVRYSGDDAITQHLGYIIDGTSSLANPATANTCQKADFFIPPEPIELEVSGNTLATQPVCIAGDHNGWMVNSPMSWDGVTHKWYKYDNFTDQDKFKIVPNCTWDGQEYPDDKWKIFAGSGCYKVVVSRDNRVASGVSVDKQDSGTNPNCRDPEPPTDAGDISVVDGSYILQDYDSEPNRYYLMPVSISDENIRVVYLNQDIQKFTVKFVSAGSLVDITSDKLQRHRDERAGDLSGIDNQIYAYQFKTNNNNANVGIELITIEDPTPPVVGGYGDNPISDGIYLEVTDQKRAGFIANHSPATPYYLDTHQGEHAYPYNGRYLCGKEFGGLLKAWNSRTFNVDVSDTSTSASLLKSPLWYAAKWGGFEDSNNNNKPDLAAEWQSENGDPESYWLVTNANNLSEQLGNAFRTIIEKVENTNTNLIINSGSIRDNTLIYAASYNSQSWGGDILAYSLTKQDKNITIGKSSDGGHEWSAKEVMAEQFKSETKVDARLIFTTKSNHLASVFTAAAMTAEIQSVSSREVAEADKLINYIRGSRALEGPGQYRKRETKNKTDETMTPYILGDIVHSSPELSGKPSYFFDDAGYRAYYDAFSSRTPVLIFGANDGMVHVINAKKNSDFSGQELFAYVPSQMYRAHHGDSYLAKLTDSDYRNDHQYYVDGPTKIVDVYGSRGAGAAWHTLAIGSLGSGGKGYYALDISDPDPTANDALLGESNRFVSPNTTPVLWERTDMGHVYGQIEFGKLTVGGEPSWVGLLPNGYGDAHETPRLHVVNIMTGTDYFTLDTASASNADACPTSAGKGLSSVGTVIKNGFIQYAYAGDLNGNMWRFDFTATPSVSCLFTAKDPNLLAQPITVAPIIGYAPSQLNGYMVYFGTGKLVESSDLNSTQTQSFYAVLDNHSGTLAARSTVEALLIADQSNGSRSITGDVPDYMHETAPARGFYLNLPSVGERVLVKSSIVENILFVATMKPTAEGCESTCGGWLMAINLLSGQSSTKWQHQEYKELVAPPTPVIAGEYILLPNAGIAKNSIATQNDGTGSDCGAATITNYSAGKVNASGVLCSDIGLKSWRPIY